MKESTGIIRTVQLTEKGTRLTEQANQFLFEVDVKLFNLRNSLFKPIDTAIAYGNGRLDIGKDATGAQFGICHPRFEVSRVV